MSSPGSFPVVHADMAPSASLRLQDGVDRPFEKSTGIRGEATAETRQILSEEIGQRVRLAFQALETRYRGLPEAKWDMLLAHYVYGLTAVVLAGEAPSQHLKTIRAHLEEVIPAERAARALEAVPEEGDAWLENTLASVESIGGRHGHALLAHGTDVSRIMPSSNGHASPARPGESAAIESEAVQEVLIP
ncbi:hypothetical protein PZN02_002953 [Sinorhizobium garamanticum]|uniref:Uncharacterized protein n=1 Tax=Sinorhizobium garamanticum TaxID=680247 RepID=A0ABY8D6Z3_9HYPH|nr:hypothetical protein [Sinorhizobium garamanticum]WEX86645.1 hypothetical protein PZN02_002953 [Sinorhizobium garamanticum]